MTPPKPKITLTFDDLHAPAVEERLRQQSALAEAQANSERTAALPSRLPIPEDRDGSVWRNALFNLTLFGLLGGLLAWGCGELVEYFNPDQQAEALDLQHQVDEVRYALDHGRIKNAARAEADVRLIEAAGRANPWFPVFHDKSIPPAERDALRARLEQRDSMRSGFANVLFYSACGITIALALGMADSVASRNPQGAVVYGSVGAVLGLVGGVVVSLLINKLYHLVGGGRTDEQVSLARQVLARAVGWGVLGLFLSAAPGIVMRSGRKLALGLIGGFVGGFIGGALFDPVNRLTGSATLSRMIAIVAIGVITGVGTAIVEDAAKQGWLRVVQGLIAGKQFILYRNPTFIGSSPHCEIYLFKDFQVGPRHAALHILPNGYDLEDLGTGTRTYVNGRPVRRVRLRDGDRVQIGSTGFTFQEKARD